MHHTHFVLLGTHFSIVETVSTSVNVNVVWWSWKRCMYVLLCTLYTKKVIVTISNDFLKSLFFFQSTKISRNKKKTFQSSEPTETLKPLKGSTKFQERRNPAPSLIWRCLDHCTVYITNFKVNSRLSEAFQLTTIFHLIIRLDTIPQDVENDHEEN